MPDNYTDTLQPPQPTVVSGTGSAVQSATIGDQKWQFDDEGGNWVNLETGEAVSPKVFSQMAGRSGNAAADTIALARAMQREEASLAPPRLRMPVMPPQAITTAPMPTAMTGTSPVVPPRAAIAPPSQFYPPEAVDRVRGQRSVPSTKLPPSDAAVTFYKMQQVQRLVDQGWKSSDALKAIGLGQAPTKAVHIGNALVDPTTGRAIYTSPPPAITPAQQATIADRAKRTEILQKSMDERARLALEKAKKQTLTLEQQVKVDLLKDQIKKLQDAYAGADAIEQDRIGNDISAALWTLEQIMRPTEARPTAISKPSAGIAAPSGTRREVPMVGTVKGGYRFKGGDPSRKENWEKVQ